MNEPKTNGRKPEMEHIETSPTLANMGVEVEKVHFRTLFRENWVSVMTDCLVFGSFGMGVAFLGPTLFDLGCQTKSDLKEMNWVFFVQLLMTLVGSISAGCLADRAVPVYVLMIIGIIGLPATMFVIPACSEFAALLIDLMLMGWCMGCIDCIANLRMIRRFETNVSPFLQAMHFFYGLGAFVSPMIAAPFILNVDCSPYINSVTLEPNIPAENLNISTLSPLKSSHRLSRAINLSHSRTAFMILGGIQLLISVTVTVVVFMEKKKMFGTGVSLSTSNSTRSLHSVSSDKDLTDISGENIISRCFTCGSREMLLVTIITSLSLFIYDGVQSSYADYIYSYAEKNVNGLKDGEGAVLNACFWGLFAFGRLISIFIATRFTPAFMLLCNLTGSIIALLLTFTWRSDLAAVYIGTCILGLFLSSMSPSAMSMAEQFININPSVTSCLVVCAALGETLCPVIVGNLFVSSLGPPSFIVFCLIVILVAMVLYWLLYIVGRRTKKYQDSATSSFLYLAGYDRKTKGEHSLIKPQSVKYYSNKGENDKDVDNMELNNVNNGDNSTKLSNGSMN